MNDREAFDQEERGLAKNLGVKKKRLASARFHGLTEGVDWVLRAGKVAYGKAGVARLMARLGLGDLAEPVLAPEKKGPAREGTVSRTFTNRHLMEVLADGLEGEPEKLVRVRVRDSKNFKRGMRVPLELHPGDELWSVARKEPRFPGRW